MPRIVQVNVKPETPGEVGLPKCPVAGAHITVSGLSGDYNRYRTVRHAGDPDKAVLIVTRNLIELLNDEGWPVRNGDLGENLTVEGIPYASLAAGQRYRVGAGATLELSKQAQPCKNLGSLVYVGGVNRTKEFIATLKDRRGWYARVLKEGIVRPGDAIELIVDS